MLDEVTKNKIQKIIDELSGILYDSELEQNNKQIDTLARLKTNFNSNNENDFLDKCEIECRKWEPVINSSIGNKLDEKYHNYLAHLLELQFKLNKGHLSESKLITNSSTILQNHAMPLIRKLVPRLTNLDLVDLYKINIYKIFNSELLDEDIYVETFKLFSISNIDAGNNADTLYDTVISSINLKIGETGKFFAGPLIFSVDNDNQNMVYVRFILK